MSELATTPNGWKVLDADSGTLVYTYRFARNATSNAFATRMADGRMLVVSPPSGVDAGVFDDLLAFGEVGALLANNGLHHLGLGAWRTRFPEARAFAAPLAGARIAKKSKDAGIIAPLAELQPLLGDGVHVREVPNTRVGETWAWVDSGRGHLWYASDVLANMPSLPPSFPARQLFKWTKSAPGYRVFGLAMLFMAKNRRDLLERMATDVQAAPPAVMVPAHGDIVATADVAEQTLEQLRRGRARFRESMRLCSPRRCSRTPWMEVLRAHDTLACDRGRARRDHRPVPCLRRR